MSGGRFDDVYTLTPMQEAMLFRLIAHPGDGVAVEQVAVSLAGGVDSGALHRAWRETLQRHDVLRTSFHLRGAEHPLQVVHREVELPLEQRDWRHLGGAEADAAWAQALAAERGRGFDPSRPPLMRLLLARCGDGTRLAWTYHHILLDGWSETLVLQEVFRRYREPAAPLAPAWPFRELVAWLKRRDPGGDHRCWREHLAGGPGASRLPGGGGAADAPPGREVREVAIEDAGAAALRDLARRSHLTLSFVLQCAWALTLHRMGAGDDVVFGATVSGRPAALRDVDSRVGLFINSVPVRCRIEPAATAGAWMQEQAAAERRVRPHQHASLARIARAAGLPGGDAPFESLLVFQNFPLDASARDGFGLQRVEHHDSWTAFPLSLVVQATGGLRLRGVFDPRRLGAATVEAALAVWRDTALALAAGPEAQLGGLLDRLPDAAPPAAPGAAASPRAVAPREATTARLVRWMAAVLEMPVERLHPDDDLFDLGGFSLSGARLLARAHHELGVELSWQDLAAAPSAAGLARLVEERRRPAAGVPLTPPQREAWERHEVGAGRAGLAVQVVLEVRGDLDEARFGRCLEGLVARHEALRCRFEVDHGQPVQRPLPADAVPLRPCRIDLRAVGETAEPAAYRLAEQLVGRPPHPAAPPLLAATVLRLGDDLRWLVLVTHQLVADGWSLEVLTGELAQLLAAPGADGAELPWPPPSFLGPARRPRAESGETSATRRREARELVDAGAVPLDLPWDRPPRPHPPRGAHRWYSAAPGLTERLEAVARAERCNLLAVLTAAFHVVLAAWTGRERFATGTVVAARPDEASRRVVGPFAVTVAVPGDLAGDPPFDHLVRRVHRSLAAGLGALGEPFELLARQVRPSLPAGRPLLNVALSFDPRPVVEMELPGLRLRRLEVDSGAAHGELHLFLHRHSQGLRCRLGYAADRFQAATADGLWRTYHDVLAQVADDPRRRVGELAEAFSATAAQEDA